MSEKKFWVSSCSIREREYVWGIDCLFCLRYQRYEVEVEFHVREIIVAVRSWVLLVYLNEMHLLLPHHQLHRLLALFPYV